MRTLSWFFENISKFIILKKNTEKVRSLYKFYEVGMNIQRVKTELKFVKTQKFWLYINTIVLMIVMLGYSEINTEVSDTSIEIIESDDYREVSENNEDDNGILTMI